MYQTHRQLVGKDYYGFWNLTSLPAGNSTVIELHMHVSLRILAVRKDFSTTRHVFRSPKSAMIPAVNA
jgi:hypothetical protein